MKKQSLKQNLILSKFRNATIARPMVGLRVIVYNGAWMLTKIINDQMVGHKIGQFSHTKRFDGQSQNKRKTKRKTKSKTKEIKE
jgi:ribosomal protein S19